MPQQSSMVMRWLLARISRKILFDLGHRPRFIHPHGALKVEIEAAVIQVDGADDGDFVVGHKGLGVVKALGILVYLDAGGNQFPVIGAGGRVYQLFCRPGGG